MGCFAPTKSIAACTAAKAMGAGADIWAISVGDISAIARNSSGSITGITMSGSTKAMKIEGIGTSARPKQTMTANDIIPLFSHEIGFIVWDDTSANTVALNNMAGDTMLFIYTDSKGNFFALGTSSGVSTTDIGPGLVAKEFINDPWDTAAVGGLKYTFSTRDTAPVLTKAPFVSITGGTAVWLAANTYA